MSWKRRIGWSCEKEENIVERCESSEERNKKIKGVENGCRSHHGIVRELD